MLEVQKVITVGDNICLLTTNNFVVDYKVVDAGIGIPKETGNYQMGFWLKGEQEGEFFQPDFSILQLMKDGMMWKKGNEVTAAKLRDLRKRQKEKNYEKSILNMSNLELAS